jgi:hypothetical protein
VVGNKGEAEELISGLKLAKQYNIVQGEIPVTMECIDDRSRVGEFERGAGGIASICKCNP